MFSENGTTYFYNPDETLPSQLTTGQVTILLYKVVNVFFLSVTKDLANYWTDMVLLSSEASYRSREGVYIFWGRVLYFHLAMRNRP